ncbi:MAG: hypothetical protein ACE5IL_01090 [Myxococcota bacterium]
MARRPPNVDRESWLAERERIWRRRNRWLSLLMLAAIAALAWRYLL